MNSDLMDRQVDQVFDELLQDNGLNEDRLLTRALAQGLVARTDDGPCATDRRRGWSRRVAVLSVAAAILLLGSAAAIAASQGRLDSILDIFDRSSPPPSKESKETLDVLTQAVDEMPPEFGDIGSIVPGSERVAIREAYGDLQIEIVLSRTSADNVCITTRYRIGSAAPGGGGGCQPTDKDLSPFTSGYHGRAIVYGVLPDGATGVRIRTSAGEQDALAKNNAYFWAADDKATRYRSLEIVRSTDAP